MWRYGRWGSAGCAHCSSLSTRGSLSALSHPPDASLVSDGLAPAPFPSGCPPRRLKASSGFFLSGSPSPSPPPPSARASPQRDTGPLRRNALAAAPSARPGVAAACRAQRCLLHQHLLSPERALAPSPSLHLRLRPPPPCPLLLGPARGMRSSALASRARWRTVKHSPALWGPGPACCDPPPRLPPLLAASSSSPLLLLGALSPTPRPSLLSFPLLPPDRARPRSPCLVAWFLLFSARRCHCSKISAPVQAPRRARCPAWSPFLDLPPAGSMLAARRLLCCSPLVWSPPP